MKLLSSNQPKRSAGASRKGLGAMILIVAGLLIFAGEARQAHAAVIYSQPDGGTYHSNEGASFFYPTANGTVNHVRLWPSSGSGYNGRYVAGYLYCANASCSSHATNLDVLYVSLSPYVDGQPLDLYAISTQGEITDFSGFTSSRYLGLDFRHSATPIEDITDFGSASGLLSVEDNNSTLSFPGNGSRYLTRLLIDGEAPVPSDTSTRIISFTPSEGVTLTGPDIGFTLDGYVNPADIVTDDTIIITFRLFNIDQNVLLASALSPGSFTVFTHRATTSGAFTLAATSSLADGNYRVEACLRDSRLFFGIIPNPFAGGEECQSHQFIVGQATFIGNISQQSYAQIQAIFASSTATSTAALARSCNLLGDFDMSSCVAYLFIPDAGLVRDSLINLRDNALRNFPVGYITDFAFILATTSTSSLTVVDVTLPAALAGAGASVHLDLAHVLDPILNATTSSFIGESAPDDRTFYEITSFYWEIFVVVGLLFYILRRVVGTHVFGHGHPFQEMSGDEHVSDESYRLKERLYEMSQRK